MFYDEVFGKDIIYMEGNMRRKIISVFVILAMFMSLFTACSIGGNSFFAFELLEDDTYEVSISVEPLKVKGKVNIPSKYKGKAVTAIAYAAFSGCKNLSEATIPKSINSIGGYAFANTGIWNESKSNVVIYISKWAIGYKGSANENSDSLSNVNIEPGTIGIADNAFYNCSKLESITIPDSVKTIGDSIFYGCSSLTSITIPNGIASIGKSAFENCQKLESVIISDGVESIKDRAFYGCLRLTNITIPDGVTSIGDSAFTNCKNLERIIIPESVLTIGRNAFSRDSYVKQNSITIYVRASSKPTGWKDDWTRENNDVAVVWDYKN